MNTRPLADSESSNRNILVNAGIEHALIFLTRTGMEKSILDATIPLRTLLKSKGIHDYAQQGQGPRDKVKKSTVLLLDEVFLESSASLYRPNTKNGDPRIWFSDLKSAAQAGDVLAVFICDQSIYVLNLTASKVAQDKDAGKDSEVCRFVDGLRKDNSFVAEELLRKLSGIARRGPIPATCEGSTAIGRAVETALGININSDQAPDYKGIEIKSGRTAIAGRATRQTLFACVPCWNVSRIKSSREMLEKFGYDREGVRKLYCTVSAQRPNAQGLSLKMLPSLSRLAESGPSPYQGGAVAWELSTLHNRLTRKHNETMWVKAESSRSNGREYFQLKQVIYTKKPSCTQFDELIENGIITLDHLIKKRDSKVVEKGPLFKIERDSIPLLFLSAPRKYNLVD